MERFNKICVALIVLMCAVIVGIVIGLNGHRVRESAVHVPDTIYDRDTIDSIRHNIVERDSIVYGLKMEARHEVEQALNAGDSDAVEQFKRLAGE